jgi:hypothetical protein
VTRILAGASVEVDVATVGDLDARTERLAKLLERPHARFLRAFGAAPSTAAPVVVRLNPALPPNGMMWLVQWLAIFGNSPTDAAVANVVAAAFAGGLPNTASLGIGPPLTGVDFANVIFTSMAVPSTNTIPDKSVVYSNEYLYCIFTGTGLLAGAANYRVVAGIIELPQTPDALMW